jgi:hypothetical protein
VVARQPWEIGERGLQLATIVDTAAPDRILAYVYLPEDDRAAGLRTLALMVAAPALVERLGDLLKDVDLLTQRDPTHFAVADTVALSALRARQLLDRLREAAP